MPNQQKKYILSIDQGTTGTRAILYDTLGIVVHSAYREIRQYYPRPGWVEHDAGEIWNASQGVINAVIKNSGLNRAQLVALAITNQRETSVLWDSVTGKPIYHAIVWQDRRTAVECNKIKHSHRHHNLRDKTGLTADPYFSASKVAWLLKNIPGAMNKAKSGRLLFGTIDTWLLWNLSCGSIHATDYSNASRTLLFNIKRFEWDKELLNYFKVPASLMPKVYPSGHLFGYVGDIKGIEGVPIRAVLGDQQAALYGQGCYWQGQAKNTYGTGCFVVMNIGKDYENPPFGLLTTLASDEKGQPIYALEGSVFVAGAAIQWLRDGLEFFKKASECEKWIKGLKDSGGVTVIPALTGLGSPYWNPDVRGCITGMTRGTTKGHIIRAVLESLAHQTADVIDTMKQSSGFSLRELKVDGGATQNSFLMQFQADLLGIPIKVSSISESTAWGVAKLAGVKASLWKDAVSIDKKLKYKYFHPCISRKEAFILRRRWQREVQHLLKSPTE